MSNNQTEREKKIAVIVEMCRERLNAGKDVPAQTILQKYSNLLPELENELVKLGVLHSSEAAQPAAEVADLTEVEEVESVKPAPAAKRAAAPAAAASEPAAGIPQIIVDDPQPISRRTSSRRSKSSVSTEPRQGGKSNHMVWIAVSGGALALAVVILIVALVTSSDDDDTSLLADSNPVETPVEKNDALPQKKNVNDTPALPKPGALAANTVEDLIRQVDEAQQGAAKLSAMKKALEEITARGLVTENASRISQWHQIANQLDPNNGYGFLEMIFEVDWKNKLAQASQNGPSAIQQTANQLEDWSKQHQFRDKERGVRLHISAAEALVKAEPAKAMQHFNSAAVMIAELQRQGKGIDPGLVEKAGSVYYHLRGLRPEREFDGFGTGFAIAAGGYIMTNHHVIEGASKIMVRLPKREEAVPATVVVKDTQQDIALIRIDVPGETEWRPLKLADASIGRGSGVAVFGFPLGDAIGMGLKLTAGSISALPDKANSGMYLLDCRVNPGNSGGPLCDTSGRCVGLITQKTTRAGDAVDTYGLARPASDLLGFMQRQQSKIPGLEITTAPRGDTRLEWDEVDQIVSPSVFMIMIKKG